jgi:DNA end-binding protein Ku
MPLLQKRNDAGWPMAKRPSWSGFLKLSLVTCPIQLYSAVNRSESVSFHFIHPETHNRIQMKPHDPDLGEVERKDLVRGYEMANGKYVTVTDEDLAEIRLKSTKTIDIERFVDFDDIDPLYFDTAYYILPDGKMGLEAYAVIRDAMRKERQAAEGRLVLSYREHAVIIQPRDEGLILHRMRDAREVESPALFKKTPQIKVDPKMVAIATEIIEQKKGKFEPATFKDPYEEALVALLKRRARGAKPVHEAEEEEKPTNVVNLMDALRSSLGGKGRTGSRGEAGKVVEFRRPGAGKTAAKKSAGKPKAGPRSKAPARRRAARSR